MKTFYVSRNNISDVLSMLWDECCELNLNVWINPAADEIRISRADATVATITTLPVSDEYDIKRQLTEL